MTNLINKTLANRYRVTEFIGRGGMAEVYKVWDAHRSTTLAIKVMHADLALDRAFLRRFKREAQTLARLQHPNIVRFYGLEQDDYLSFMVMDYVEGKTLKHKIFDANGPMPIDEVLKIMRPLCQALQYAHNEGFVHADVKPGNVLIDNSGRVMLTDFGIARMTETATVTMIGAGTPAYMSPEQARGEAPTKASDIYSLGVLLFEMLTGERPFNGEAATVGFSTSEKVRWEQINLKAPSAKELNKSLPEPLVDVMQKVLEKNSEKRYQSALDLLNDLERALSGREEFMEEHPFENRRTNSPSKVDKKVAPQNISSPPLLSSKGLSKNKWFWIGGSMLFFFALSIGWFTGGGFGKAFPSQTPSSTITPTNTLTMTPTSTITPTATPYPDEISDIDPAGNTIPMRFVAAGEFVMGSENSSDASPAHVVFLDDFYIDKYEVTNKLYRACVYAGVCEEPGDGDYIPSPFNFETYENHPVVEVNWDESRIYCEWRNAQLPSEAQWEKAARGTDERHYPWSTDKFGCDYANVYNNYPSITNGYRCVGDTMPIGSYEAGKSPYGVYDLIGNVAEWVADQYSKTYYDESPYENPLGPHIKDNRVYVSRGGGWNSGLGAVTYMRTQQSVSVGYIQLGFRCARSINSTQNLGQPTPIIQSETADLCNKNRMIISSYSGDVTVSPGQKFTITWEIKNDGFCPWASGYYLDHFYNDEIQGEPETISGTLAPNERIKLSLTLTAPWERGEYDSYWVLRDNEGQSFGEYLVVEVVVN